MKHCCTTGSRLFWLRSWDTFFGMLTARGKKIIVKQDYWLLPLAAIGISVWNNVGAFHLLRASDIGLKYLEIMPYTMYVKWHIQITATSPRGQWVNTLAPGRCGCNLKLVIFKHTSRVDILSISCEIALRWMPQDFTDDKSTLVQVMAWCRQATSHYLGQCWPPSISPYGVARPQWVKWASS